MHTYIHTYIGNIAWGLHEILSDPARAGRIGSRGHARCAEFSWDSIATRTEAVYRELFP